MKIKQVRATVESAHVTRNNYVCREIWRCEDVLSLARLLTQIWHHIMLKEFTYLQQISYYNRLIFFQLSINWLIAAAKATLRSLSSLSLWHIISVTLGNHHVKYAPDCEVISSNKVSWKSVIKIPLLNFVAEMSLTNLIAWCLHHQGLATQLWLWLRSVKSSNPT